MRNHALISTKAKKPQNTSRSSRKRLTARSMKSSKEARKLIGAALRESRKYTKDHKSSSRIAAKLLRLPSHGQLVKMQHGLIKDTPAMEAAKLRADNRARRAYYRIEDDLKVNCEDVLPLAKTIEVLAYRLSVNCLPAEIRKG